MNSQHIVSASSAAIATILAKLTASQLVLVSAQIVLRPWQLSTQTKQMSLI
jgi:hypothetical protein